MSKKLNRYIVITACKNEAPNLQNTIKAIVTQTIMPSLWFIVNDGSTDKTSEIIGQAMKENSWIKSVQLNGSKREIGFHLSEVVKTGFTFALDYCHKNNIYFDFLANIDGDITIPNNFFEKLIMKFDEDKKLGIVSGETRYIENDKIVYTKLRNTEPSGGDMIIKKECFEDCGGITISCAWDSTLKAKARIKGWHVKRFNHVVVTECRRPSSVGGYWRGLTKYGMCDYFHNLHPIHVLIKGIKFFTMKPYYIGLAYFIGYMGGIRIGKIQDEEIKHYFWNKYKHTLKDML